MAMSSPARALRHRRVWLTPALSRGDVAGCEEPAAIDRVIDWARKGRPVIGRGALPHDTPDLLPLGLAWIEAGRRLRLSFCVPMHAVERIEEPLPLAEVAPTLPPAMRSSAMRLVQFAVDIGMPLRVYGSVFWQHTSGEAYLHDHSDLDLLAQPETADDAKRWLDALELTEATSAVRIDGEVELPTGEAVAWRELAAASEKILVKSDAGPSLRPRASVWSAWAPVAQPC
ncbi:MAG: malonate decarboxylase holo-[acyl-carrier-protein] synthase [Methylibium sp.]|uniref:malonate decarboxylase holo-[acyl-carrier-protein] synthase n=1 Tax=Methylibium sp. TaxID=2067992 RepID=UPI0017DBAAC7|nr:malonate decarboxylase holo-[acyl-carrier-protein] synthase [Methylibium sp.]MBA3595964.1 malonate decarboxylase holo-[acyl-carrier-protein] synthase [Methylibium sp.]